MTTLFPLKSANTFTGEVDVFLPGKKEPMVLELEFKWLERNERNDLVKNAKDKDAVEFLKEILVGWHNVDGEFNEQNLKQLTETYHKIEFVIVDYWRNQLDKVREKN